MQLVYRQEEHIEFPYDSQPVRHLSQPPRQFAGGWTVELENRDKLAQPPGCDPGAVESPNLSLLNAFQRAGEGVEPLPEECRARRDWQHGVGGRRLHYS
jgi:hypothetical protein